MSSKEPPGRGLKLLRDFIALVGGDVTSKVVGFLAFAYLARTLDKAAYGAVESAVAVSLFFAMIIDGGLGPIGVREATRDPKNIPLYAGLVPTARLGLTLLSIPSMLAVSVMMDVNPTTTHLIWLFAAGLLALPWKQQWLLQSCDMMVGVAGGQLIRMLVFAGGLVLLVKGSEDLLQVGFVEVAAALGLALYYLAVQQISITPIRLNFSWLQLRLLVKEGISLGLAHMVWAFHQYISVIMVTYFVGEEATAEFGTAHRLTVSLFTLGWLYHFNLFPVISRKLQENAAEFTALIAASTRLVAWSGALVTLGLTLLSEPVLTTLYGTQYATSAPSFTILIWTLPITILGGHARWSLIAKGKQKYVLVSQSAGALVMLIAGVVLIPLYQVVGAAIAMLLATLAVWLTAHLCAARQIDSFPSFGVVLPPTILVLVTDYAVQKWATSVWTGTAAGLAAFLFFILLFSYRLWPDFKLLARAKAD